MMKSITGRQTAEWGAIPREWVTVKPSKCVQSRRRDESDTLKLSVTAPAYTGTAYAYKRRFCVCVVK